MQWPSSLQATMTLLKPIACAFLALSTCLHLLVLDTAAARTVRCNSSSSSSSCYRPSLHFSVSRYLMQQGALSYQANQTASTSLPKLLRKLEVQVLINGTEINDSSRGSIRDGHIQNTTKRGLEMMGRIGSTPPSCTMRCAGCAPCTPVHVPIQHGRKRIGLLEYYPEAWRCECKNKLYMPGSSTLQP